MDGQEPVFAIIVADALRLMDRLERAAKSLLDLLQTPRPAAAAAALRSTVARTRSRASIATAPKAQRLAA